MLIWTEIATDIFVAVMGAAYTGGTPVLGIDSDGDLYFGITY